MECFSRFLRPIFASSLLAVLLISSLGEPLLAQLYEYKPLKRDRRIRTTNPLSPAESYPMVGTPKTATDTRITIEVFTGKEGVGYQAQQWEPAFERAGISARIRPSMPGDKISIHQKQYGKLREVYATGKLERSGTLTFPGHSFTLADTASLEEWIRELKSYGAEGSPTGKPIWGLTKSQFEELFRALSATIDHEVADAPFDEAVRALHLPERYPFRISAAAEKLLTVDNRRRTAHLEVSGFSQGTGLAIVLSQYGLAFRPNRTPDGRIELLGVEESEAEPAWPIGWEAPPGTYPSALAPKLFDQTVVELKDQKLIDVLEAIGQKTSTPVRIDLKKTEGRDVDLNTVVTIARRRMTWSQLLISVTSPSFLTAKIRSDEAKKPFVWVTILPRKISTRPIRPLRGGVRGDKSGPDAASKPEP